MTASTHAIEAAFRERLHDLDDDRLKRLLGLAQDFHQATCHEPLFADNATAEPDNIHLGTVEYICSHYGDLPMDELISREGDTRNYDPYAGLSPAQTAARRAHIAEIKERLAVTGIPTRPGRIDNLDNLMAKLSRGGHGE